MTNKEYIISMLGFAAPANSVEAAMIDAGILEASTYVFANSVSLKLAAINVMRVLLTTANTSNSITGFSVTYDRASIFKRIALLEEELGISTALPTITSRNVW